MKKTTKKRTRKKTPTAAQKIAKSKRLQRLMEDEDLKNAFLDVQDALHDQFDQINPTDVEAMVKIKERLHLLTSVEQNLMRAIQDGQLEEFKLAQDETPFLGDLRGKRST